MVVRGYIIVVRGYIIDAMPVPGVREDGKLVERRIRQLVAGWLIVARRIDRFLIAGLLIAGWIIANHVYYYGIAHLIAYDEEQ